MGVPPLSRHFPLLITYLIPFPSSFPESPSHASVSPSSRKSVSRCLKLGDPPQMDMARISRAPSPRKFHLPWGFHFQGCLTSTHPPKLSL